MEQVVLKQSFDKQSKYVTLGALFFCVAFSAWLLFRSTASFISAWFFFLSLAVVLLLWIGMAKTTVLNELGIRIYCTLNIITIDSHELISVEPIACDAIPVISTLGFMGYRGYYYFKGHKKIYPVLSRGFNNLVLVRYGSKSLVIGVPDSGEFVKILEK